MVAKSTNHKEAEITNDVDNPALYENREISWLKFNDRVLEEALDPSNPLLERIRFLTITESNLDEFFMVRVAGLKQKIANTITTRDAQGLTPEEQVIKISKHLKDFSSQVSLAIKDDILPSLHKKGVRFIKIKDLQLKDRKAVENYFRNDIFPILTPLAIDIGHPFPRLANRSLNMAVVLKKPKQKKDENLFAVVQVPQAIPSLYRLPGTKPNQHRYIWLKDIMSTNMKKLFPGFEIQEIYSFKITRDSDIIIEEDEVDDLLTTIQRELRNREKGAAVRLEIQSNVSDYVLKTVQEALFLEDEDIYLQDDEFPLSGFKPLFDDALLAEEQFTFFTPIVPIDYDKPSQLFDEIKKKDILIHLPFDSFSIVEDFIAAAAEDPGVLAIKMTLYRTGSKSSVINNLIRAARNGKQVTALVELKARFDEERNIQWAQTLEEEGIHVVYGLIGYKTHCKMLLVAKKERNKVNRYVHLSTGNYNSITARLYTDIGIFTNDTQLANDITHLFNSITGYAKLPKMRKIFPAPGNLKKKVISCIQAEAKAAKEKQDAHIIAKINSLVDTDVAKELYLASQAGVKIELIVRGACCVRAGIKGISENITVRSIVGRLLEHSRIFYFKNSDPRLFLASADWMPRNFTRRIETMFPIEDQDLIDRIMTILSLYLSDNKKARVLLQDGTYKKVTTNGNLGAQEQLIFEINMRRLKREQEQGSKKNIEQREKKTTQEL